MLIPGQRKPVADSTASIIEDLQWVREEWGNLLAAQLKGTQRPWSARETTLEERAINPWCDSCGKRRWKNADGKPYCRHCDTAGDTKAPGEHPAPMHIDVTDVIIDVTVGALELEDACRDALDFGPAERAGKPTWANGYDDHDEPDNHVHWACVWIEDALPTIRDHADLLTHVKAEAARFRTEMERAIGYLPPVQHMPAPCPFCGEKRLTAYHEQGVIVCEHTECSPPEGCCEWLRLPGWDRSYPTWRADGGNIGWTWLAYLIDQAVDREKQGAA